MGLLARGPRGIVRRLAVAGRVRADHAELLTNENGSLDSPNFVALYTMHLYQVLVPVLHTKFLLI